MAVHPDTFTTLSRLKAIHGHSIKIEQNMPVELPKTMSIHVVQFSQA